MNATKVIYVHQNDKENNLSFKCREDDEVTPIDLTGATATLKVQRLKTTALKFQRSMAIAGEPEDGNLTYTVQEGDFDIAGTYYGEVELEYSGSGRVETLSDFTIICSPELPRS